MPQILLHDCFCGTGKGMGAKAFFLNERNYIQESLAIHFFYFIQIKKIEIQIYNLDKGSF